MPPLTPLSVAHKQSITHSKWVKIVLSISLVPLVLFLAFFDFAGISLNWRLDSNPARIEGAISGVEYTGVEINESPVYRFDYVFVSPEIGEWYGKSYDSNESLDFGDTVAVLYNESDPGTNKIEGMDATVSGYLGAILFAVFFFPLALIARYLIKRGRAKMSILNNANVAHAKLVNTSTTGVKINDEDVYKLEFQYEVSGTSYDVVTKTTDIRKLTDEPTEMIVYDQRKPENAIIVDSLPSNVAQFIKNNWS